MKVVLMNWAPIWKGAAQGGGVNGYLSHLAPALAARGHEVTSIFSGLLYTSQSGKPFTRRHGDFQGIRVLEIINSPVLAPSAAQFREPMAEIAAPSLEFELARLLDILRPDICHWHNLEGFSTKCIDVCRDAGSKVVFSLHNYHTLCPQVTLSKGHRKPCTNFHGGVSCVTCIDTPDPTTERARRITEFHAGEASDRTQTQQRLSEAISQARHELAWPLRAIRAARRARTEQKRLRAIPSTQQQSDLPGTPTDTLTALQGIAPHSASQHAHSYTDLTIQRTDAEYRRKAGQPLSNEPAADPTSGHSRNAYASRRSHMIGALNRCDRVLAVSEFVRQKYIAEGVNESRIETMRIGTVAAEHPSPQVPPPTGVPVRLLAVGFNHFNKGIPLLLAALQGMPAESLRGIGLTLCARGVRDIGPEFRKLHPPLAELNVIDGYTPDELPRLMRGHDLCYVGSTWWDPLPQTVLEAHALGVPVLGARAGGIEEAINEGHDGFLFAANDPASLRSALQRVMATVAEPRAWPSTIQHPKSIATHAEELETLYDALQSGEQTVIDRMLWALHRQTRHSIIAPVPY